MTLIKALLQDQVLTLIETPVIASGGVEEDVVSFDFGIAAWDGYIKKAVFYRDESDVYHVDIGSDNTAVVPWEVLRQEGFMFLGVFGTKGSEIKTSTVARYRVENGAITTASELNPTPNIYADIIANTAARHSHSNKTVLDGITAQKVTEWNGKSNFSGSYNDLTNKPEALLVTVTDNNGTLTADKHYLEIATAIIAGTTVLLEYVGTSLPLIGISDSLFFGTIMCDETSVATLIIEITNNNEVNDISAVIEKLPNPNALTFTGAVTGTYDGSAAKTVNIPTALKNPKALTIKVGSTTVTYDGSAAKTIEIADGREVSY